MKKSTGKAQRVKKLLKPLLILLWGVACFLFFQTQFPYHFFYEEQNQLFLMDWGYVSTYFDKPAWLACLVGDFLTQFYYYLYAGAAILTVSLLILGDLVRRCFERCFEGHRRMTLLGWIAFALAIAAMTLEARLSLYEGYKLGCIIALIGSTALWYAHSTLNEWAHRWWMHTPTLLVLVPLTYWLFGFGLVVVFMFEILRIALLPRKSRWRYTALIPFCLAAMLPNIFMHKVSEHYCLGKREVMLYPCVINWVDYDQAVILERNFAYDNEYYFGHYEKVIQMYESNTEPETEEMCFFYCLSLAQLDQLPDKLMTMKNPVLGTFYKIGPDTPLYTTKMINELYYLLGDMTYAERAALLANTFSPRGRNVRMVKRLAETNLVKGDDMAAMKYLRLLSKTWVYRQWAANHTPTTMTDAVRQEVARKRQFINKTDHIRVGDDCYTILTQLLDSNPANTIALDYLLCSDIVARQKEVFHRDYEKYGPRQKALYQQALTLE